jgi:hypothetical protein
MTDQQVALRFVPINFWHASISTTSGYLHSETSASRLSLRQKRLWMACDVTQSPAKLGCGSGRVPNQPICSEQCVRDATREE